MRFLPAQDETEKQLQRRAVDMARQVQHRGGARYSGFLSDRGRALTEMALRREGWENYRYDGGYQGAERTMLCVFEDVTAVAFPLAALQVEVLDPGAEPGHRDFLGAALGTGISRDFVGDVVIRPAGAVIYVAESIATHVCQQLDSVGRAPAKACVVATANLPVGTENEREQLHASVASLRLDAVLAAMLHSARGNTEELVARGAVQVNHVETTTRHLLLQEGDLLTVRGKGRFRLEGIGGTSKKGRIFIAYTKY